MDEMVTAASVSASAAKGEAKRAWARRDWVALTVKWVTMEGSTEWVRQVK